MADGVQDPAGSGSGGDDLAGGGSSAVSDPKAERLEQLEAWYEKTQPLVERWRPLEEDILALEDEDYREFQRASRKSYNQMVEDQKRAAADAIPPAETRLLSEFDKRLDQRFDRFKPVLDDYESRAEYNAQVAKDALEKHIKEGTEYAERLVAERKLTPEQVGYVAKVAMDIHKESGPEGKRRLVSFEEAYKRLYGPAEARAAEKPVPKSLRAKSAAPGVPGASKSEDGGRIDPKKPGSFTNEMLKRLNSQRKVS